MFSILMFQHGLNKSPSALRCILGGIKSSRTTGSSPLPLHTNADPAVARSRCSCVSTHASAFECLHVSIRSMQPCACCVQEAGITAIHAQSSSSLTSLCHSLHFSLLLLPLFYHLFSFFLFLPHNLPLLFSSPLLSPVISYLLSYSVPPSLIIFTFPLPFSLTLSLLLSHPSPDALLLSFSFYLELSISLFCTVFLLCFSLCFLSSVPCFPPLISLAPSPLLLPLSLFFSFLPASHHSL